MSLRDERIGPHHDCTVEGCHYPEECRAAAEELAESRGAQPSSACRCGVNPFVPHFCSAMGHAWIGRGPTVPAPFLVIERRDVAQSGEPPEAVQLSKPEESRW